MGNLVLNGATSGATTLQPTDATTQTITLPANSGTVVTTASTGVVTSAMLATGTAGNGPAFSAYNNAGTSISSTTWTKIPLQVENFDTASCFDNTTNYRFQPNVAGYYQINGQVNFPSSTGIGWCLAAVYKNGSAYQYGGTQNGSGNGAAPSLSLVMSMNGSTDYIELWGYVYSTSGNQPVTSYVNGTTFSGVLVRAA